jgi:hypothetical protein
MQEKAKGRSERMGGREMERSGRRRINEQQEER